MPPSAQKIVQNFLNKILLKTAKRMEDYSSAVLEGIKSIVMSAGRLIGDLEKISSVSKIN